MKSWTFSRPPCSYPVKPLADYMTGVLGRASEAIVTIAPTEPKQVLGLTALGYGLTRREQEVIDLVVRGASTRQISQALFISEYTVKDHLAHIFDKVGVRGRRELTKRLYLDTIFP